MKKGASTILFRMLNKEEIEDFELVYGDSMVGVYELKK